MNRRPIGLNHGEHCDSGDWEFMCDECRDEAAGWPPGYGADGDEEDES